MSELTILGGTNTIYSSYKYYIANNVLDNRKDEIHKLLTSLSIIRLRESFYYSLVDCLMLRSKYTEQCRLFGLETNESPYVNTSSMFVNLFL